MGGNESPRPPTFRTSSCLSGGQIYLSGYSVSGLHVEPVTYLIRHAQIMMREGAAVECFLFIVLSFTVSGM